MTDWRGENLIRGVRLTPTEVGAIKNQLARVKPSAAVKRKHGALVKSALQTMKISERMGK